MAGVGFTSGSRSSRALDWVNNIVNVEPEEKKERAYRMSCVFANIWGYAINVMPQEVVDDYDSAGERLGIRMDGYSKEKDDVSSKYTMTIDDQVQSFNTSKLAPASGSCARNYYR
jgi:hypothetical protein